jgi:hypothetical protein
MGWVEVDIKAIKRLAQEKSAQELGLMADEFENSGNLPPGIEKEPEEYLSDLLQAMEVRLLIDSGLTLADAVREFSKRVRSSVNDLG